MLYAISERRVFGGEQLIIDTAAVMEYKTIIANTLWISQFYYSLKYDIIIIHLYRYIVSK